MPMYESRFEQELLNLRRDKQAPHKPILLLALFRLIDARFFSSNRFRMIPELIMEFRMLWSILVTESQYKANFALPFYHLKSSYFWKLIPRDGLFFAVTSSHSIRSLKALTDVLDYVEFDQGCFEQLCNRDRNKFFQDTLLRRYFPGQVLLPGSVENHTEQISAEILNSSPSVYRESVERIFRELPKETIEEEIYVRGSLFKREIPKIYRYRCAISGMQIESSADIQMIDACHIVPFSVSKNDTISNGISLCPNLHRAFDRGLIGITDHYTVKISKALVEIESPFSVKQFEGQRIHLPDNPSYAPSKDSLAWHFANRFLWG